MISSPKSRSQSAPLYVLTIHQTFLPPASLDPKLVSIPKQTLLSINQYFSNLYFIFLISPLLLPDHRQRPLPLPSQTKPTSSSPPSVTVQSESTVQLSVPSNSASNLPTHLLPFQRRRIQPQLQLFQFRLLQFHLLHSAKEEDEYKNV